MNPNRPQRRFLPYPVEKLDSPSAYATASSGTSVRPAIQGGAVLPLGSGAHGGMLAAEVIAEMMAEAREILREELAATSARD